MDPATGPVGRKEDPDKIGARIMKNLLRNKTIEDKKTVYTITYDNIERAEFKLSFYYKPARGGAIQFKNQMDIEWTRGT